MRTRNVLLSTVMMAITISLMLLPLTAQATTITNLTFSNEDLGLSGNFAVVSVTVAGNEAAFSVDANEALLGAGANFGIQSFGFNSTLDLTQAVFSLPEGWGVVFNHNLSAFGIFYANPNGTGNVRKDPLEFKITASGITAESDFYVANEGGYHYTAHIAGFTNATTLGSDGRPINSAWFADGPVNIPEPEILTLFGLGLLALAGLRRLLFI